MSRKSRRNKHRPHNLNQNQAIQPSTGNGLVSPNVKLITRATGYSGPLPPPESLQQYEAIIPGLAERIVSMAEKQSSHRIELENRVVDSQLSESKRGQYFGFLIGIICIGAAVWLGLSGFQVVATTLSGTTIIGLVTIFVVGKNKQKIDLDKKS